MKAPHLPVVNVLLVDDLPANLLALSALLRRDDVRLLQAASGAEALELLLRHPVALALVDVQMPEMDGFALAELMRGSQRTRGVPIVFVTAGASDERRLFQGYESGAVDFLHKPLDPHILKSKVDVFVQIEQQKLRLADELREKTETLRLNEMFSAMLGHDLRGPLNVLIMNAMLQKKRAASEAEAQSAQRALDSTKLMGRMIGDMLDLARTRLSGGIPIRRQFTDLGALLASQIDSCREAHPARIIELMQTGDTSGHWDPDRLAQAVSNLLGNALQHGEPDAPVTCALDGSQAATVLLTVSNRGGIAPEVLATLFDPFRDRSRHRGRGDGLGLGLYIVEQIVRAHGGEVAGHSEDGVTRFELRLPRA